MPSGLKATSVACPPTAISATFTRGAASTTTTVPEASQAAHTSRPSGRNARLTGFLYVTASSSRSQRAPLDAAMPYCSSSVLADACGARAVRVPATAADADSGVVGCAIVAFAAAKSNGLPCAFAWQARHVFSVDRPQARRRRAGAVAHDRPRACTRCRRRGTTRSPRPPRGRRSSRPAPRARRRSRGTSGRRRAAAGPRPRPSGSRSAPRAAWTSDGVGVRVRAQLPQAELVAHRRALVARAAGRRADVLRPGLPSAAAAGATRRGAPRARTASARGARAPSHASSTSSCRPAVHGACEPFT